MFGTTWPTHVSTGLNGPATRDKVTGAGQTAHAAGEFESILLNQWLEEAESTFGSVPQGEDDEDSGNQQMKSFAVQSLAKAFTTAGGIGLSKLVAAALDKQSHAGPQNGNGVKEGTR